jgi:hypothetical protein
MKPTALHIERWLSDVEARIVPPERKWLQVIFYETPQDKEKALARFPDIFEKYTDDLAAAKAKALAEHIAAHPEDAGRTVADFRWFIRTLVLERQEVPLIEDELTAKEAEVEDKKIEDDIVVPATHPPLSLRRHPPSTFCRLIAVLARSHGDPCINVLLGICADRRGRNGNDDPARSR